MNYKNIMAYVGLLIASHSIFAKNKPQIFFTNEYGEAVIVKISWKSKNFPYLSSDEVIDLREHDKNLAIKAPYSYYKLIGISVSPKSSPEQNNNIASDDQDFEIPLAATNEDVLTDKHVQNQTYFIIKASPKDSAIPGQKRIYIQGYNSQEKYAAEIAKTEQHKKTIMEQAKALESAQQSVKKVRNTNSYDNDINSDVQPERPLFQNARAMPTQSYYQDKSNIAQASKPAYQSPTTRRQRQAAAGIYQTDNEYTNVKYASSQQGSYPDLPYSF